MKNFYQKSNNKDTIPIVLPLERRHTMETNRNGMREQIYLSERASSASSLDKLSVSPTIPRAKTRDVQKSLSSDTNGKDKSKATKIVSETDLSSSWLYKTMQASINAKFKSPRKSPSVQQAEDIEPIPLKDPNLKPIPVKSSAERTSSCLCYFATMVAISICAVGFLASIAGIIYLEVFASRNITSLHASETQVDLSDVALDSLESHNDATAFGRDADGRLPAEKLLEETSTVLKSSVNEVQGGVMGRFLLTGDPDVAELDPYINRTEAKIKFRDGQTIIYEVNTNEEQSSNTKADTRSMEQDGFNKTEDLSLEKSSADDRKAIFEKSGSLLHLNSKDLGDVVVTESKEVSTSKLQDFIFDKNLAENDSTDSNEDEKNNPGLQSEIETTSLRSTEVIEPTEVVEFHTEGFEHEISSDPEANDLILRKELIHSEKMSTDVRSAPSDWSDLSNIEGVLGSRAPYLGSKVPSFIEYVDHTVKNENDVDSIVEGAPGSVVSEQGGTLPSLVEYIDHTVKSDHDVDSMVMTVDEPEPEEVSTVSFERNGEFSDSTEYSSFGPFSFTGNVTEKSVLPKKTADIKVSLAEAMKHLHALDTQNKLVTMRKKTPPSKVTWSKRRKPTVSGIEDTTTEKISYLQKVRMMLYRQLQ